MRWSFIAFNIDIWRSAKSKTIFFSVIIVRSTHDLSRVENLNFATSCLKIRDLPTVRLYCNVFQINLSTFNDKNHYVKFQDLKLSTKTLLAHYLETYST